MTSTRIDIRKDQVLGSVGGQALLGDLYLPESPAEKPRPAVVLIFGGGWRSGERSQQKVYGINLAQAGFVCLATDYRWSTQARWPAQLEDVQTAIRWLKAHAGECGVDPDRIGVSGNSSGGHLALMAGAASIDPGAFAAKPEGSDIPATIRAVCAFYPPVQLAGLDEESRDDTVASLLGADASEEEMDRASPLFYAGREFPPVMLLCGGDDRRVPIEHSWKMHKALEAAGNPVDLHVFSGQGHAFDVQLEFARLCAVLMTDFFKRNI